MSAGMRFGSFWTDEKLARAKRLYLEERMTFAEVAQAVGATIRQIAGRAQHLGWKRPRNDTRKVNPRLGTHGGDWNDARVALLKKLWFEGKSAGEIRKLIAEAGWQPSRNTILGKVHRMGWAADRDQRASTPRKTPARHSSPQVITAISKTRVYMGPPPAERPAEPRAVAASTPKPWTERLTGECCWPVSGEGAETFSCCAPASAYLGQSGYCAGHAAVMFSRPHKVGHAYARSLRRMYA